MSIFFNGRRIGKPAAKIGQTSTRKNGRVYKKTQAGWMDVGTSKKGGAGKGVTEETKLVKRHKARRYR